MQLRSQITRATPLSLLILALVVNTADAQAPLRRSAPDTSNPCLGVEAAEELASCGLEASRNQNYAVAKAAWTSAAERGDRLAATWLATLYASGDLGERDYVQAYKWYDIAAYMHGAEIERLPPGTREDNQQEINFRDATGRKLSAEQMVEAQRQAKEWVARKVKKTAR
ncbi:hypothetical protein [Bradyrhizobium sp. CCBAU 51627]|uniref:hypothetical protein n=1 Tax=Bradyrhizobium sp. CCBAU 51627 TaxID=1325088 RepID=UPI0023056C24|nr:hypothetical protein [Bradyrhizobium sp. CCBAU 51627]MDA9432087.1 hypothetical protein [Bradyrhizobium sp. CCBAU 51627]